MVELNAQASSSGGCIPGMLSHDAIVVTPEECASFPHRSALVESEDGSYSSRMSNKSEKNMADFEGEESGCEEEELSQLAAQAHVRFYRIFLEIELIKLMRLSKY